MRALTLHRPWPWAILHLEGARAKRVENRTWRPPAPVLGELIAIHAGATFDLRAAEFIRQVGGKWPPAKAQHPAGIVGVARIVGYCEPTAPGVHPRIHAANVAAALPNAQSIGRWYMGSFGWLLGDVVALPSPVACSGGRRLWAVPSDVEARVLAELNRAEA